MSQDDFSFRLFQMLHGGLMHVGPMKVGDIPPQASAKLGWKATAVHVSYKDAQKLRFHKHHAMDQFRALQLPLVIGSGDYYRHVKRGTDRQIEVVLHEPDNPKRAYFLVLSRNEEDTAILIEHSITRLLCPVTK